MGIRGSRSLRPGNPGRSDQDSLSTRGFTLVELLISVTLFMAVAFVLYTFIGGGVGMWRTGERRQDLYERAQSALDTLAADLWCTFRPQVFEEAEPVSMFLADRPGQPGKNSGPGSRNFDLDPNQALLPVLGSRLRFVRTLLGEFQNPLTRSSGRVAGASAHYQTEMAEADPDPVQEEQAPRAYKAAAGLMELIYQAAVLPDGGEETGLGTLLRGERLPVGGTGSLFRDEVVSNPGTWTRIMRPVVDGVLYLGLEFWDQDMEAWDSESGDLESAGNPVWDSTRGILPEFRYYRKGSEKSDIDDIYPQRVRITLILARPGDPAMTARLSGGIGKHEKKIRLDRPGGLQLKEEALVLVGGKELMEITRTGSTRAKIIRRGVLGTPVSDHGNRCSVVWGEVFTRVVNIPCYKENHNR